MNTIQAQIIEVDDLQARRISAAENLQREDLSAIEDEIIPFVLIAQEFSFLFEPDTQD